MQVSERWSWFVGGILNFSGEPDADVSDSATYGGFGGARYKFSDKLAVLVVGKAEDFDRPLDGFGPVTALDVTIPGGAPPRGR